MSEELIFKNGTKIVWTRGLDGGGSTQYIDFLSTLHTNNKVYNSGLEWCAGLGAIGYSILDAKLCQKFTFMDIYDPFEKYIIDNSRSNNLQDKVDAYCCDAIGKLPASLRFDLVVSNPPHCSEIFMNPHNDQHLSRITTDNEWKIHKEFFTNIKKYLYNGADLFISELTTHPEHIELARLNGIHFIEKYEARVLSQQSNTPAVIMHYRYEEKIY